MTAHTFHIPVMGTGFTIDTALKVARFGISSAMSVDDNLMEMMREHYCSILGEAFTPIPKNAADHRARRITEYLNFVLRQVERQTCELRRSPFSPGSEISLYFELLDDGSVLKERYRYMLSCPDGPERAALETDLRQSVEAGSIDINILTKLDRERYEAGRKLPREYSDALSAIRGFANSKLRSSVVFSAGVNLHLFSYLENFADFYDDAAGPAKKQVIIKVSDYRSAFTQGKIFARKGIWVREYRIESGLNCGGHAFATQGQLLGPVLEEFKKNRHEFVQELFEIYNNALAEKKGIRAAEPPPVRITAQGGIGTAAENRFLRRFYRLDGTGWGTPFLLVPEATSVDEATLSRLLQATENDIYLSNASPMGVPIYNLRTSLSEEMRLERIREGRPGSPCLNGYMAFNTEFSDVPLCTASRAYQARKIDELNKKDLPPEERRAEFEKIVEKACICHDLGDSALAKHGISYPEFKPVPAVCPGPNLVYFFKISTLKEMVDHVYGRTNVLSPWTIRRHFFINELHLYVSHLKRLIGRLKSGAARKEIEYLEEFKKNLAEGVEYYKNLVGALREESESARRRFISDLAVIGRQLDELAVPDVV